MFTDSGLKCDPLRVDAINQMPPPTDVQGLQRLLGVLNYMARLIPQMSKITAPLRTLIRSDVAWSWDPDVHGKAFETVKQLLREAPVLKYFDSRCPTTVLQCDASQCGLGVCILQDDRPVAYASRALTANEINYAQIEKELLAIVFGMKKFHTYLYGRHCV